MPPERTTGTICPTARDGDDEVARKWAAGALSEDDAVEFEAHMLTCTSCHRAADYAKGVTAALRTAAHEPRPPVSPFRRLAIPIAIVALLAVWMLLRGVGSSP